MELFPALKLGWLNGWLPLVVFYAVFGLMLYVFPKDVVQRLYDRSGWTQRQRRLSTAAKLVGLVCMVLIILTPLKVGHIVFVVGMVVFSVGVLTMVTALINYRNTPMDEPVTRGLYRISRNPQWVALVLVLLGICIAVGSWTATIASLAAMVLGHVRILAEEQTCLEQYGEAYAAYMDRVPRYFIF